MKPKLKTLNNGLRILAVEMPNNPTVTVSVMVEVGTRFETRDNNGISHFLEHMCFKGTKTRSNVQIAYELEALGAETNAFTSHDYTGYYAKGKAEHFEQLTDVVADVYLNSIFPESEIEKERGVILGEINMYEDMPARKAQHLFAESLYGEQPAGYATLGLKENIRSFSRNDFINYHKKHYIAEKTIVVVAGNVSSDRVFKIIEHNFKTIKTGRVIRKKRVSSVTGPRIMSGSKQTDQAHVVLGLRTIPMQHPDEAALSVAVALLGQGMSSRLFVKVREELGAGYYIHATYIPSDDVGKIVVSFGTEPVRVGEVVSAVIHEMQRLQEEPVSDLELNKTKEYMIGGLYMSLESSDAVAYHFGTDAIMRQPLKTPQQLERELRSVTIDDIRRVAKKYLKKDKLCSALIAPAGTSQQIEKIFPKE